MGAALLSNKAWRSRDSPTDSKDLHNLWALLRCNAGKHIRSNRYPTRNRADIRPVHQMPLPLLALGHREVGRQHSVGLNSTREPRSIFPKYLDRVVRIAKSYSISILPVTPSPLSSSLLVY
ncbi:hypothetical protein M407DRAFT_245400 [Tulasnella calospora MUT 4182]|uniref:Uncharacterized protein n=1 Tax=Tulasnella calospora MUT 4182 TaxID=1051891 RepID=A0A0C3LK32_9AGAM|nr:hypothetical protein M407DRAFT_245400 [Tulasnella calospora MUT 4182]